MGRGLSFYTGTSCLTLYCKYKVGDEVNDLTAYARMEGGTLRQEMNTLQPQEQIPIQESNPGGISHFRIEKRTGTKYVKLL